MKRLILIMSIIALCSGSLSAQTGGPGYYQQRVEVDRMDTTAVFDMLPLYVFRRPADMRRYARLIRNIKIVYPIAKQAKARLEQMEGQIMQIKNKRDQKAYIKQMERDLKREYTPVLKRMTFSQGKILIKLIDRETSRTSYELVKELRGSFSAFFWQGIARIFGANLKDSYDKLGEDKVIEQIILLYEAGLI